MAGVFFGAAVALIALWLVVEWLLRRGQGDP